jgi:hypothetical protein
MSFIIQLWLNDKKIPAAILVAHWSAGFRLKACPLDVGGYQTIIFLNHRSSENRRAREHYIVMGFLDKLNVKKTLDELNAHEGHVEVAEHEDPRAYSILERGSLDIAGLVAPESVSWEENYYKVGDEYTRTLYIHTYPPQVEDNWLKDILRFQHAIDVSFYIQPVPIRPFLHKMRQQAAHDEASILKEEEDGLLPNQRRVARLRDTQQFITAIEEDITKPYQVMVAMTLRARSVKELERVTEDLERSLTSVTTRSARHRHKHGFETTLPLMDNELAEMHIVRSMHTQGIMSMFPFTSSDITHDSGVLIGISQLSGSPIIVNRFMQPIVESPNTAILGMTGSGKSFFAKLEMLRWAYQGVPVIVLDPSGEYRHVCEGLGGANVEISLDSEQVINPLDFSNAIRPGHNALREKIAFMIELLRVMMRSDNQQVNVDPVTKQIFENSMTEVYRQYGYRVDDLDSQLRATPEHMPILAEVVFMLNRIGKTNRDPIVQERIRPLMAALQGFVGDGHLAPLFNRRTTVDLRSHMINFNYSNLAPQYLSMAMHLVLEFLRTSLFTSEQSESGINRLIYVDEAQILMAAPETAHFLQYTARTCRKYGVGLTVMTQNVGVFVLNDDGSDNKIGQGVLANCSITVLLKQQPNEAEAIRRAFHLTEGELSRLLSSRSGEGLIFVGQETGWFSARDMASPLEYAMLTTTMSERAAIAAERRAEIEVEIDDSDLGGNLFSAGQLAPGPARELPPAGPRQEVAIADEDPFADDPFA